MLHLKIHPNKPVVPAFGGGVFARVACALPVILALAAYDANAGESAETVRLNARLHETALRIEAEAAPEREPDYGRNVVFAHYMTCFFNSVEFYKQEIELAQRHGIQGFALNCGQWGRTNYVTAAERIYEAAKQLDTGFKIMMSPDHIPHELPDMVERFYEHPNQFRWNGRAVMSGYGSPPPAWAAPVNRTREAGFDFIFVPNVSLMPNWKMAWSLESALSLFTGQEHMDGVFYFAVDGTVNDLMCSNALARRVTQHLGKIYMAGIGPAYNSPNVRDFQGFRGYAAMWESIIRDRPEWVEIVTWNDYNEDSHLMPWRWQRDWQKQYNDHDEAFLDITGYYARWFASRRQPEIVQDKIYCAYRNRSMWLRNIWDPDEERWVDITLRQWPFDQYHDDVQDLIHTTTFLTAPAELSIEIAGETHTFQQPAGVAHVSVPLAGGVPKFSLSRAGGELVAFSGRKQIIDEDTQTKENSWKGYHLANRLWTGGAAVGTVVAKLNAADGELLEGAEIATVGGTTGVRNQQAQGSGFRVSVNGLETATYNVRVRYSNPSGVEARLTLYADGPPRAERDYPYYIPLFMPPTGQGEFATVSFLWSLYDTTTYLSPVWRQNTPQYPHPLVSDQGSAVIESIELVKVEPTPTPERRPAIFPEMVAIPGGTFTMGSNDSAPDERPAHQVTLSPFAIGRYEVTNEEYERFAPEHRSMRDGFSWRDREPVIYVRWTDAVRYCNWLSEQAGLEPCYLFGEGGVEFNVNGEGFRLPSEAEWEYVASGRGEGRRYPWGNDEPAAGKHGNFPGYDVLAPNPNIPSDAGTGSGTMTVGSYPPGASRDGVMDMAGNVCEWVNDWFHPYSADAKTNPHVWSVPSHYRSIRGSSFGYYGRPLHVADREYNNPNYGGYIYIGFRVVLPENGLRKLAD